MATGKYSGFLYGDGTTYGAVTATEGGATKWILLVDWNNDGVLDGTSEANRLTDVQIEHGRQTYFAPQGGGFEHMRPARCRMLLDNYDRRYDSRNSSSALYPNVKPGRRVQLAVKDLSTGNEYTVFTGKIDDIVPLVTKGGQGDVQMECVGYMAHLNDQILSFTAADQNITLTRAFEILLDDAQFPGSRNLDSDGQPIVVYGITDQNAGSVAHDLADAGMGTFFVDKTGRACFYGRNHTFPTATDLDESQCLNTPVRTQPWSEVYNHVTAIAQRPIRTQASVIYFLPGPVQLTADEAATIDVDYQSAFDLVVSNFEVFSNQNGTGTDLTASTTVTSNLGYNGGTVTVTCTSNGYLTELEIRGRQWGVVEEKKVATDSTSQNDYGLRRFLLDSPFLQDPNYATNHAGVIKDFAKDDRDSITLQIQAREDLQFGFDLMTPVALTAATLDIDDTYYVMGIEHEWTKSTGEGTITTLHLSKIISDDTSVTSAPILNEPRQAPISYNNPAGDPGTIDGVIDSEDPSDVADYGRTKYVFLGYSGSSDGVENVDSDGYREFDTVLFDYGDYHRTATPSHIFLRRDGTYMIDLMVRINRTSGSGILATRAAIDVFEVNDAEDSPSLEGIFSRQHTAYTTSSGFYHTLTLFHVVTTNEGANRIKVEATHTSNTYSFVWLRVIQLTSKQLNNHQD